jgi:hypothetical protein
MTPLADALEELATGSELKSEVVCCLGLEPFVEFDLRGKTNTSGDKWRRGAPWEGEQGEVEQREGTERTTLG